LIRPVEPVYRESLHQFGLSEFHFLTHASVRLCSSYT
jgi:hypothetical protein